MKQYIQHYFTRICDCLKQRKPQHQPRDKLQPIITSTPFEHLSVDYVHLETSSGGYEYILIVMDHFTRFAQCYPTRNKSGETAAEKIYNDFVLKFGFPENCTMIREKSLKINFSSIWKRQVELNILEPHHTTLWGTNK